MKTSRSVWQAAGSTRQWISSRPSSSSGWSSRHTLVEDDLVTEKGNNSMLEVTQMTRRTIDAAYRRTTSSNKFQARK